MQMQRRCTIILPVNQIKLVQRQFQNPINKITERGKIDTAKTQALGIGTSIKLAGSN